VLCNFIIRDYYMKNAHTVVNPIMSFNPFYRIVYTACILIVISSPLTMNE